MSSQELVSSEPSKTADPTREELEGVIARFRALNDSRTQRMLDSLPSRQGEFLHLLPLLLHCNHPQLPGFISSETPCGISDYSPTPEAKRCAARLARGFVFRNPAVRAFPIHGLFIMGSVGTVAYSKSSDLDIWLCHSPGLEFGELEELSEKTKAVELWAATLGLEVHFFFINTDQFRSGIGCPVSKESTGSIQHHLLLEEFYRSALYVAGRVPLWWLVPPDREHTYTLYTAMLKVRGLLGESDYLDFGGLDAMPADEFLAASLWHLYKAIASPHKSLLKLLLMESYASEYPAVEWVGTQLKRAVYDGETDANVLDPYILMYRKVDQYLASRNEAERLDLARQSFYLKANESLSQESAARLSQQRRAILRGLIQNWGWENAKLALLDTRRRRLLLSMIDERKEIVRGLRACYQAIRQFAGEHARSTSYEDQEVVLIGRMLFAALEKKPGKVDIFAVDSDKGVEENEFSLHEIRLSDQAYAWCLYLGRVRAMEARRHEPIKKANSLIEILAWMAANGIYDSRTFFVIETIRGSLPNQELNRVMKLLCQFMERNVHEGDSLDAYKTAAKFQHVCLLHNIGQEQAVTRNAAQAANSNRNDPFSFGMSQTSLVVTTELVSLTSWHEVMTRQYEGVEGLFECLCDIYNQADGFQAKLDFQNHCFLGPRGESIVRRVRQLFDDMQRVFGEAHSQTRYIVRGERRFYMFNRRDGALHCDKLTSMERLMREISRPTSEYSSVLFDPLALEGTPVPAVCTHNRQGVVQVFALSDKRYVDMFILDERGAVYFRRHHSEQVQHVLNPYAAFLEAVQQRHALVGNSALEYYWVTRDAEKGYMIEKVPFASRFVTAKIEIRVIGQELEPGRLSYTICTDDKEFSTLEDGRELFKRAAEYVYQRRLSGERYPIYVTDIDVPVSSLGLSSQTELQTIHFLKYKDKIETMLNSGGDADAG